MDFQGRVLDLPVLGLGVSTEYGAGDAEGALDPMELRRRHPGFAAFLEVGVEVDKGIDRHAQAWAGAGLPTTYHFLDVNLDEPEDFDALWLDRVCAVAQRLAPAWMCGDAGLWHFGRRDRGHMLLLPPVLTAAAAADMAPGIVRLRDATGLEVLPENPPGTVFLGDMHVLEFFAAVCERADTGMLLDCAHLAIFQRVRGLDPLAGFADFDLSRVVELHVAGGTVHDAEGLAFVEDDHGTEILEDTWTIFRHVIDRAPNLRAVVFECERNGIEATVPGFEALHRALADAGTALVNREEVSP